MSHFSVIVATREYPTEAVLRHELQPFHEFECTGVDDEFVRDIDETDRLRKDWETDTTRRLRDPQGGLHEPWDDRFFREPTAEESAKIGPIAGTGGNGELRWHSRDWGDGRGYRAKVQFVPGGWAEEEVTRKAVETFAEYVGGYHGKKLIPHDHPIDIRGEHKYGYALLDERGEVVKVIDRTNPDKRWDWWVVGGRYCRKFTPKSGSSGHAEPLSWVWDKRHGCDVPDPPDGVDIIRVGDMDKAAMKAKRAANRKQAVAKTLADCGVPVALADDLFAQKRAAHQKWVTLDEPRPRGKEYGEWCGANGFPFAAVLHEKCWGAPDIPEGKSVEQWADDAPYLTGFAFLRERKWAENGKMGWWGAVHDEKEAKSWEQEFQSLVDAVPDDWHLSVVDCHI
jgi:hypothetical protein